MPGDRVDESPRPPGLRWVILPMCAFNLAGAFQRDPARASLRAFLVVYTIVAGLSFVVVWFFWLGRNWARWLVLATSIVALINLAWIGSIGSIQRIVSVAEAVLGVWLLYWLNTRSVRAFFSQRAVADSAPFRRLVRAHIGAGFLVVAGIAGLMAAFFFPVVLGATLKGNREAAISAGGVLVGSMAFALAVWLLFYLPSSVAADMITKDRTARLWLSSLLCMIGVCAATLAFLHWYDQPPHIFARISLLVQASIILGLGCALYSFLKRSFSRGG